MRAIKPLEGQALIEIIPETRSDGGLHLIDRGHKDGPGQNRRAKVIRLGAWQKTKTGLAIVPEVKPGQVVLINQHTGRSLVQENSKMKIISLTDILAVFE